MQKEAIPFELFASFKRIETGNPDPCVVATALGSGDACNHR